MPEAPEVQTVLSTLEAQIKDVSIEDVLIYYPKIIDNVEVETFKNQLIGQTFHSFNRLGKYLIFGLDDYDLVVHLRMEGKFYLYNMLCENKHIHIVFIINFISNFRLSA
ncbi:DNA-formamidopyrimidine glycosylase family protein [Holdemanella porci]|uniref:DNA-formamidopyrimidine glycosylase family protein n=1 Tax=Holdemanella porci TaxID=2652276 RepID=UPI003AB69969